jgi:putative flippase GtrA
LLDPSNALCLQIANIISWICGVTFAYFTNRKYVFESKNANRFKEATSFVSARIVTLLLDMLLMGVGVSILHFNDKIMKIVSQILVIVLNYVFSKLFVFRGDKDEKNDKK